MGLATGTKLGPYEIVALLGAGGMGEVYRARDTKLNREVALKILPESFADQAERKSRFQREAQILASLNHPHIAAIYGLEESGDRPALAMEIVEGPTLADHIARGAIAIEEALPIAKQIAEAVEYAHEKGVTHRDLKPANIKVTPDGNVKVLDFGLAKVMEEKGCNSDPSSSPTFTSLATQAGMIIGTAAYMSPEQAKGKAVDKRADIWAFGCVLYEMLTGQRAFHGETATDTLAAVIRAEPDWAMLPPNTPSNVTRLLHRCLEKDAKKRLRDIGDARADLEDLNPRMADSPAAEPAKRRYAFYWAAAGSLLTALAIALSALYLRPTPSEPQLAKLQLLPPEKATFADIAISPDGRRIAFTATDSSGKANLWLRSLDSLASQQLAGTDRASYPFWSPDSRFIGFFADSKLKKIEASGGSPQTICDLINDRGGARGGSWSKEGVILFAAEAFGPEALYQVSATGGKPDPVTTLEDAGELHHHHWPSFLPDGRHFLYFVYAEGARGRTGVYLASLGSKDARLLFSADASAVYIPHPPAVRAGTDYILFVRERTLMAQPFNAQHLEISGSAIAVAEQVGVDLSVQRSKFSISENGVLVYDATGGGGYTQLLWFDRAGKRLSSLGPPGLYVEARISPDGRQVAAQREDGLGGADIWLLEPIRGTSSRFTFSPAYQAAPVWSPDGSRIRFFSSRQGRWSIYEKPTSGVADEQLVLKTNNDLVPYDWSPDGKFLLYTEINPKTRNSDIWVLPWQKVTDGQAQPAPFQRSEFDENFESFSPDGNWVVYQSNESGRNEVYVRQFHPSGGAGGGKWQISIDAGVEPRWPRRGKEIFYIRPDNVLMAVEVKTGAGFEAGVPHALFPMRPAGVHRYDVTADGQRFLVSTRAEEAISTPATVVLNWFEELKRNVPVR